MSKRISRSSLYALSTFYMKGISLFMVPFVVNFLQAEEFGRLEYIGSFAIFLSVIVAFGLEDTLYRFCGEQQTNKSTAKVASTIYGLVITISILFTLLSCFLLWFFEAWLNPYISSYLCLLIIITLALEGIISVPLGWMRMRDNFVIYCTINVGRASLQAGLTFILLKTNGGIESVFEAGCIAAITTALLCFFFQYRSTGINLLRENYKNYLHYAYPIVICGLLAFFLNGFDKWVIAESSGLTDLAFYAVTGKFAVALTIAMQPYGMWWSPARFSVLNGLDGKNLVSKFSIYGLLQIILFSLLIGIVSPIVIFLLFPSEFLVCIALIGPLLAVFAIKESAEFLNIGCFTTESTVGQMKITLISISIGIALMIGTASSYGMLGVISSLFIAQLTRTFLLYVFSQNIVYLTIPIIRLSFLMAMTFVIIIITNILLANDLVENPPSSMLLKYSGIWLFNIIFLSIVGFISLYPYLPLKQHSSSVEGVSKI